MTEHLQVPILGIPAHADIKSAPFIEWLHTLGVSTSFSCQGDSGRAYWDGHERKVAESAHAYVAFSDSASADIVIPAIDRLVDPFRFAGLVERMLGTAYNEDEESYELPEDAWEWTISIRESEPGCRSRRPHARVSVYFPLSDLEILNTHIFRLWNQDPRDWLVTHAAEAVKRSLRIERVRDLALAKRYLTSAYVIYRDLGLREDQVRCRVAIETLLSNEESWVTRLSRVGNEMTKGTDESHS